MGKEFQISFLKRALLNPALYPDQPQTVAFHETHISLVFLTGNYAYKVKKPVDFGFLDFTSIEKRRHYCEQEVILNRRLAPTLYLGVVGITQEGEKVILGGQGDPVEYAVQMIQIPETSLMNHLLARNEVTLEMIEAISEKLVRFYLNAETNERISNFARPERVKEDTDENFDQTEKYIGATISKEVYREIQGRTIHFFKDRGELFVRRIDANRIRDCHGDLRLEHIFWGDEISIFDCIEFNERFRYTDVAADIAFLAMDLDYHNRQDLSDHLIRSYIRESGDDELMEILDFYKCYRAYVRGKVESFRLDDLTISEGAKEEASKRAQKYFDLAHRYSQRF